MWAVSIGGLRRGASTGGDGVPRRQHLLPTDRRGMTPGRMGRVCNGEVGRGTDETGQTGDRQFGGRAGRHSICTGLMRLVQ